MIDRRIFRPDDYGKLQARYFSDLRATGVVDADPSGWLSTYSQAETLARVPRVTPRDLARYYIDEGIALGADKERICSLVSSWEGTRVEADQITLCPSGASISLVTLAALKASGVQRVLFETPGYFGTIEQATEIGLPFQLVPTYRAEDYRLPDLRKWIPSRTKVALWVTQPRASLGFDQRPDELTRLLDRLGGGFLVVDEATDQSFPAHLAAFRRECGSRNLIRLRSFTKGMGLNGLRLAAAIHPRAFRRTMVDCLEALGGSLDVHSLRAVGDLGADMARLRAMLRAANQQVNDLRAKAERMTRGSPLQVNRLTNGYIGSMVADLSALGRTHSERRTRLLEGCRRARTPVMLGASMYLAKDHPFEAIRLNLFNHPEHIIRGIANVIGIWQRG